MAAVTTWDRSIRCFSPPERLPWSNCYRISGAFWRRTAYATVALLLLAGSAVIFEILPLGKPGSPLFRFAIRQNGDLVEEIGWPETCARGRRAFTSRCPNQNARGLEFTVRTMVRQERLIFTVQVTGCHAQSAVLIPTGHAVPGTLLPKWIVLGSKRERLEQLFASAEVAGHTPNPWQIENEETRDNPDIFVCRGLRVPWKELWPKLRSFG